MSGLSRGGGATLISTGDATVNSGDLIVTDTSKGIVMTDNEGEQGRLKIVDDNGVKTVQVEVVP